LFKPGKSSVKRLSNPALELFNRKDAEPRVEDSELFSLLVLEGWSQEVASIKDRATIIKGHFIGYLMNRYLVLQTSNRETHLLGIRIPHNRF
jgi:hypothetical protein